MEENLRTIFCDVFRLSSEDETADWTMESVPEWDSLKHMNLIAAIEKHFGIELSFDDIVMMQSFAAIKNVLNDKGLG